MDQRLLRHMIGVLQSRTNATREEIEATVAALLVTHTAEEVEAVVPAPELSATDPPCAPLEVAVPD